MLTRKFLIQFECDDKTQMLRDDAEIATVLKGCAKAVAILGTSGPVPAVSVIIEEQPEPDTANATQS